MGCHLRLPVISINGDCFLAKIPGSETTRPININYCHEGVINMVNELPETRRLINEVSKAIGAEVAPGGLELADELLDDYYSNPAVHEGKDNPLGFGSELLAASTPVIAMSLQALFNFIVNEAWASAQKEGAVLIAQKMKALLNPVKEKAEP